MPRVYDFNDFIKKTYGKEDSTFTCVTGPNGSGKTEFNLLQLERIHDLGLGHRFGSNMPVPEALKPHFEMDFIEDFETLEETCKILNPNPDRGKLKKYFFFLSELGKFVPKDQAWKKDNIEFIVKLQTVRKVGLSMLSDGIDRIDGRVLSPHFFNGEFKKPFATNPKFAIYEDYRAGKKTTFKKLPKCKMWFDTYYSANFYMTRQSEASGLVLDQSEQIVKQYMDSGSWKKVGVTTQQGKRELFKILKRYYAIREPTNQDIVEEKATKEETVVV